MTSHISKNISDRFINLQEKINPDIYVEVGAFDAEFSKIIINKYPNSEVWAFEANPYVYNKNYPIDKINYINKAISDNDGFVDFEIQKDKEPDAVNNSILKRNENKDYEYISVESIRLNTLLSNYKNICLWIDCEGANKEVLMGASEILKNVSSIFIEVEEIQYWQNQWLDYQVKEYLESFGFELVERDEQYNKQYNCIFVKKQYLDRVI